jgi:hypothetical protein
MLTTTARRRNKATAIVSTLYLAMLRLESGTYFVRLADVRFAASEILAHLHNLYLSEGACRFNPNLVS